MQPNAAKYSLSFILIHWMEALLIVLLLGLGWYLQSVAATAPGRTFLVELHISLGLTSLLLTTLMILVRLVAKRPPMPERYPRALGHLNSLCYAVIYICLLLMPLSGYLQAIFKATTIKLWGFPLPLWGTKDLAWAEFFWTVHGIVAFVLTGLLVIHVGIVLIGVLRKHDIAARMLPGGLSESRELAPVTESTPAAIKIAQKLARSLRVFGWMEFWLQLALAFVSGLLLVFATSGRAFSPGSQGLGDGMLWAGYSFLIVWLTILLAFYYTRCADKVTAHPEAFIDPKRKLSFWFLGLGIFWGVAGLLAALTGVGASIALLVAKTVSQPPGIAITDPNKIIRALDVFVLLVNFNLLMAHFIGTGTSLWLGIKASRSRFDFHKASNRASKEAALEAKPA